MTLIVMKTLERVYKNYYFIIRGDVKIYSKKEMIHLLLRKFHNVNWERIGITSCMSFATK